MLKTRKKGVVSAIILWVMFVALPCVKDVAMMRAFKMGKYKIKKVGSRYMIFDNEIGEFLFGYIFNTDVEAYKFIEVLNS